MGVATKKEWLTVAEVQELLSIGRSKAYQLVTEGTLPAVKIGRIIRVSRKEVDQWLTQNRYTSARL